MSEVRQGVIGGVTSSPTNNGGQRFSVAFSDGNTYSTFDQGLANRLFALVGQQVQLTVEAKPNPRGGRPYLNVLDGQPLGGAVGGALQVAGIPQANGAVGGIPSAAPAATIPQGGGGGGGGGFNDPQTVARIVRGNAANAAAQLLSGTGASLDEFFEVMSAIGRRIALGPQQAQQEAPVEQTVPVATDPVAVAAAVNEAVPGAITVGAPVAAADLY